jgi:hypothetical protein
MMRHAIPQELKNKPPVSPVGNEPVSSPTQHATLRMVFQLPTSLESIIQNVQPQNPDTK